MPDLQKITPCLWFDRAAEEAAAFYVSLFPDSAIEAVHRYGPGAPLPEGEAMLVRFRLAGRPFQALNGGPIFKPTEANSLVVACEDQAEIDRLWEALSGEGGQAQACGWVKDRWGYSWQIVPRALPQLLEGDPAAAARVMQALWGMIKLDIAALEAARAG